ncbi:reverse transcriptase domain-containing protein [Tanacetum coccineum]
MVPATTSLIGFSGEIKWPLGQITLLVKIGDDEHSTSAWMDFMVVRSTSPHNGIIGRPGLRKIQAVPSTAHGMIKFPVMGGILTLKGSKIIPVECVMVSGPEEQPILVNKVKEERVKVAINPEHPEQTVMIGSDLTEKTRSKLCNLLQRSLDIFAWTPTDMTGVPRQIAEHRLNVRKGCQPVRQKKRGQAAERNVAINDEVSKLVTAGIMREVHYHDWLSNPVMVKKSDNSWRMCVDFKDLNKACPKDGYPLPEIDWKVESLCGFPFKCFLDAYKGYHQIQMAEEDEEKTAFITNQGIFCYTKMPFGLRNAGATYQRLVDKTFHGQIGRNLESFLWTEEAEAAFRQMKEHIAKLPMLIAPEEQEELIIYLAASKEAGPEVRLHRHGEKLVLALVHASKRLRRYFQAHPIIVVTDQPIKNILSNPKVAAEKIGVQNLEVNVDSKLEANQVNGTYIAKETDMIKYLEKVKALASTFRAFSIKQVPRSKNKKADALSKMASTSFAHLSKQVLVEELKEKSVNEREVLAVVEEEGDSWMTPIHEYLTDETLPAERKKARAIKRKSQRFAIINGILYKKSFLGPWLRCVGPSQANYDRLLLADNAQGRKGAYKSMSGMPSAQTRPKKSAGKIEPNHIPVAILQMGYRHLAGTLSKELGEVKFLILPVDYFSQMIEAKLIATITGNQVKKFVWENIVCRFGLPGEIISDNGKQFRDNPFKDWCEKLCIQQHFKPPVKHPQMNGLVERANRSLGEGIKARLGKDNKNWLEEISHVLWAHRTMIKTSNGDTPFSLTYRTEAVIFRQDRMAHRLEQRK